MLLTHACLVLVTAVCLEWITLGAMSSPLQDSNGMAMSGDLRLTSNQHKDLFGNTDDARREKRAAYIEYDDSLWPNATIPYLFNPNVKDSHRDLIRKAMKEWENGTCLSFTPVNTTYLIHEIEFYYDDQSLSCRSDLGMFGGTQLVNLGRICMQLEVVLHEIGHAIGLIHEHQRPDRDQFVTVNYTNVKTNYLAEFDTYLPIHVKTYNKSYDFWSIMHYGSTLFAKGYGETIVPKNSTNTAIIDRVNKLPSKLDKWVVNQMYKCKV